MTSKENNENAVSSNDSHAEKELSFDYERRTQEINTKEQEKWTPKILYVPKRSYSSDNNLNIGSTSFISNKLNIAKPPVPSEWGNEKTELPESERLKNLNTLLNSQKNIPISDKNQKIRKLFKNRNYNIESLKSSVPYDTSFDPEKEFSELNSRYPSSSTENLNNFPKRGERCIDKDQEKCKSIEYETSNESLKNQIHKKSGLGATAEKGNQKKMEIFEPQPGTSKMEPDYNLPSSDISEMRVEGKSKLISLQTDKKKSEFSLRKCKLEYFGNQKDLRKNTKVRNADPIKFNEEKFSSKNMVQLGSSNDDSDFEEKKNNLQATIKLEELLREFPEKKDESSLDIHESNFYKEKEDHLIFSWSSSDLSISRWSLPNTATNISNSIINRISIDYVVNSVVKNFIDVRQLAPINYCRRPAILPEFSQEVKLQKVGASNMQS